MRIHQLSPAIANQIAAGEVIERPASVVKELLENSLDAESDAITIEIGYGGLNQIKISDNGLGIVAEDLPLAVAAHATSKITTLNDLYAINTMGFRGEALASIASVAKVTITSRPAQQEHAMTLRIHGAHHELTPGARALGTTIDVVDLFFNAPVRKKFLKNEKLEFQAIEMVIKRFALSAPHIALTLKHNNKSVLFLPAAINEQAKQTRMTRIFGSSFIKDAIFLDVEVGEMRLCGWTSGANFQRSQNDRQWVYINQRMVKDKLINHALKQAYDGLLHPGRFPACLLYFTINTNEVDVNVHPTKHEVRFQQPRLVHDFFTSQLTKALSSSTTNAQEAMRDYDDYVPSPQSDVCEPSYYAPDLGTASDRTSTPMLQSLSSQAMEPLYKQPFSIMTDPHAYIEHDEIPERSAHVKKMRAPHPINYSETKSPWVYLNNQYTVVFIGQEPYLVDLIALLQQQLLTHLKQAHFPLEGRPLLVPISYSIPVKLNGRINELQEHCRHLGIHIELLKEGELAIRSVPIQVPYLNIRLFLDLVSELEFLQNETLLEVLCLAQDFDPKQLSIEERMELNQYLLNLQSQKSEQQGIFKALSVERCRMLLHV